MNTRIKNFILFCLGLMATQMNAQVAFEESFEAQANGFDLTTAGYHLSQNQNYTGTVTAMIGGSEDNQFARLQAQPNGAARMEIAKTISVEAGKIYTYEVESKGPFKRQLRVYGADGNQVAASADYKPATNAEQTAWKSMAITFLAETAEIQIAFHHYWSGTIDLDNFKVSEASRQPSYYISSSSGDDNNPGTKTAPFQSLAKLSTITVFPGDSVLFKRGERFDGHYIVNGSGSEEAPVLITGYGEGDPPIITGQVGAAGGGDYLEAILVANSDNLIFDGLEVRNDRTVSRGGVSDVDAFGINVRNTGAKVMNNLTFRNMTIRDVFAPQPTLEREDFDKIQVSGLSIHSDRNTQAGQEKNINNIVVKNCLFANIQRLGIKFSHGRGNEGIGNDSINRNTNIHIYNNEFSYNGGSAVLANGTYNCLIENNIFDHPGADTDPRMPARGSSVWNINAINTISQYNMCISTRGYLDSYGIHIDHDNVNTFVQYNYMYDCEGGFVEILKGNENAVYRFNVSVNSGFRESNWERSNSTIYVYSDRWADGGLDLSDGVYIHNNTVVIDEPFTTSVFMDAKNMFVYNNIFSSTNGAGMADQNPKIFDNGIPLFMKNNLFEGTVNETWMNMDENPVIGNPSFTKTGDNEAAYQIRTGSPVINAGIALPGPIVENAGYGVFKDIPAYPVVDFYGNPIDLISGTPNIGACNDKMGVSTSTKDLDANADANWLVYPQLAANQIKVTSRTPITGALILTLSSMNGQIVQQDSLSAQGGTDFDFDLNAPVANGIYVLSIRSDRGLHSRRLLLYR